MNTTGGCRINNNYSSSSHPWPPTTTGNARPTQAPRPQQQQRQQPITSYPQILQQYQSTHSQHQQQQQKRKKAASQHGIPLSKTMNFSETTIQAHNNNNPNSNLDKNNNNNMRSSYDAQQQQVHVPLQQVRLNHQESDQPINPQYQQQQQSFWTSPSPAHSRPGPFNSGNQKTNGVFQQLQPHQQNALDQSRSLIHDNSLVVHTMPDSPSPIKPIKHQISHLNCSSSLGKDLIPQIKQLEARISLAQQNNSFKENINNINMVNSSCKANLSTSQKWRSRTSSSACANSQELKKIPPRVADKDVQQESYNFLQDSNNNNTTNASIKRIQSLQEQVNSLLVTQETLRNEVAVLTANSQNDKQQLQEKDAIIQALQAQLAQFQLQQQQKQEQLQSQPQQQPLPFQSSDALKLLLQDVIDIAYVASILLKDDEEEDNNTIDIQANFHENTTTATPTASNPFQPCPKVILKKLQEVKRKFNNYLASISLSSTFPDVKITLNLEKLIDFTLITYLDCLKLATFRYAECMQEEQIKAKQLLFPCQPLVNCGQAEEQIVKSGLNVLSLIQFMQKIKLKKQFDLTIIWLIVVQLGKMMMHSRHISTNSNSYECCAKNILSFEASDKDAFINSSHFTPMHQQLNNKYQQEQSGEKQTMQQQQQQYLQQTQMFQISNNNRFSPHEILIPQSDQINSSSISINNSNQLPPHVFVKLSPSNNVNPLANQIQHNQQVQVKEQLQTQLGFQQQQQQNYNNYFQQEPHVTTQQLQQQPQSYPYQSQQHQQVQTHQQQQQQQQFHFQPVSTIANQRSKQQSGNWQGVGIQHVLEEDKSHSAIQEQNQQKQLQQFNGFKQNQQQNTHKYADQQSQQKHDYQLQNQQQYYDQTIQQQNSNNHSDQIYSSFNQGEQFNMLNSIPPCEQLFHGPHESFGKKNELSHHSQDESEEIKAEQQQDYQQLDSKRTVMPKVLSEDQHNFLNSHAHSSGHQKEIELSSLSPCFNHTSRETSKRSLSYSHRYSSLKQANDHINITLNTHKNTNNNNNNLRNSTTMDTTSQNMHNNLLNPTNKQLFPQGFSRFPTNQSQKVSHISNPKTHSNHASIISYDALRRVKTEADETQLQEESMDFHQNLSCNDLFDTQNYNNYDKNSNRYIAKHDYTSKIEGGLSFKQGDIITVHSKMKNGWWNGTVDHNHNNNVNKNNSNSIKSGYFPCNYVMAVS